jgi:predicted transcriptional regulator
MEKLTRATDLLLSLLTSFDDCLVEPQALFRGEPFLSSCGLHTTELGSFCDFMDVVNMMRRHHTVFEIAERLNRPRSDVKRICDELQAANLIKYKPATRLCRVSRQP